MPTEKWTYFSYREGLDLDLVRVGNLVHDYGNPKTKRPFVRGAWTASEKSEWISEDERPYATLIYQAGKGSRVSGGIATLADIDFDKSGGEYTVIIGELASKSELKEPEKYFEEVLLKSEAARIWFSSRLAVARKLEYLRKITTKPSIWLLTGIYLIQNASTWSFSQSAVETSAKAAIPLPDVTMLSQLLQLNPEAHFKVGSRILKGTGTQIKGSRVWAAQYQKIHAPYVIMKQNEEFSFSRIRILSIFSAERGNGNAEAADLSVEKNYAIEADEADDLSEEYWEDFEGEVEKLDEILAEEE